MNAAQVGYFVGQLGVTFVVAIVVLGINSLIPPLRQRIRASHYLAMAFSFIPPTILDFDFTVSGFIASLLICAYLYRRMQHAIKVAEHPPSAARQSVAPSSEATSTHPEVAALRPHSSTPAPKPGNYFVRHWQGDLPLATSYWINATLIASVLPLIALTGLSTVTERADSLRILALTYILAVIVILDLWLWGIVGVWRSSDRHVARGGRAWVANLVKALVVLGVIGMTGRLANTFVPQLNELTLILVGKDPVGSYKATISNDGKSILVKGMFREGSAQEIEKLLDSAPGVRTIVLSSGGGRLLEGTLLAMAVRKRALNTYVEDTCVSTCTFVFLAGRDRSATPNAKIGFHTPSFPGKDPNLIRSGTEFMMDAYREAGLSRTFVDKVRNTPASSMWYPTRDELIEANVITRVSLGGETTATFTGIHSKQELMLLMRRLPLFVSFEKRFPGYLHEAVDHAWKVKERGGNDAEISAAMRAVTAQYSMRLVAQADDASLAAYARIFADQLKAARLVSYDACVMRMNGQLDITAALPKRYWDREQTWEIQALSSDIKNVNRRQKQIVKNALQAVGSRMPPALLDVAVNPAKYQDQPGLQCDSIIAMYDAALSLPPNQRAAALEGLLKGGT